MRDSQVEHDDFTGNAAVHLDALQAPSLLNPWLVMKSSCFAESVPSENVSGSPPSPCSYTFPGHCYLSPAVGYAELRGGLPPAFACPWLTCVPEEGNGEDATFAMEVLYDCGEPCVPVECGEKRALLYPSRLCQGSRGLSILYGDMWLTPNEFQSASGRENAKDWKRSIKHKGRNLKWLICRGLLSTHPPVCEHTGCGFHQLTLKDGSQAPGQLLGPSNQTEIEDLLISKNEEKKQEESNHLESSHSGYFDGVILKVKNDQEEASVKRYLPGSLSSAAGRKRQLPETESLLSDNSVQSHSPLEKQQRTSDPQSEMTPREHLRKMSALGEQGNLEEKHWYRLVNNMAAGELRQRQEVLMRNQMTMNAQLISPAQQRMQAIAPPFEPRFLERDLVTSAEMVPSEARQMHIGSHLGPPLPQHSSIIPSRGFQGAGFGFLPSEPMDSVARRQEMIHKQNLARMEMNAILHQKEMESAHQKGLLGMEAPMLYPSIPTNAIAFRGRHRLQEGHLPSDLFVQRTNLEDLQGNALLMSSHPYPTVNTLHREKVRRSGRRASNQKNADCNVAGQKYQLEEKVMDQASGTPGEEKELETKGESEHGSTNKVDQVKMDVDLSSNGGKSYKECEQGLRKSCNTHESCSDPTNCSSSDKDLPNSCSSFHDKYTYSGAVPHTGIPFGFPVSSNGLLPPGAHSVFINGDEMSSIEDIRKWTVDDVYNFISNIPGCSEYAQTFKDHVIDGETLPLLTEEHLLDTLGLKLGPALKIRSQVSRRLGSMFYMMNLPVSTAMSSMTEKPGDQSSDVNSPVNCNSAIDLLGSPCSRELENTKPQEQAPSDTSVALSETT
ncbi:sterile alpha motif domain-containing protein 7 isoform X2 [Polypterus senegalus]|uniref:sterile alpha motif domain-containing protein 7 isoform X2 n=1 Tax=Polypterus senegalus TaxID=55291 RepID=UPI00196420F5|nr:sterile alpha motif domain-containing protein 7 isoform X2 [Polypterus senegalus]